MYYEIGEEVRWLCSSQHGRVVEQVAGLVHVKFRSSTIAIIQADPNLSKLFNQRLFITYKLHDRVFWVDEERTLDFGIVTDAGSYDTVTIRWDDYRLVIHPVDEPRIVRGCS